MIEYTEYRLSKLATKTQMRQGKVFKHSDPENWLPHEDYSKYEPASHMRPCMALEDKRQTVFYDLTQNKATLMQAQGRVHIGVKTRLKLSRLIEEAK